MDKDWNTEPAAAKPANIGKKLPHDSQIFPEAAAMPRQTW